MFFLGCIKDKKSTQQELISDSKENIAPIEPITEKKIIIPKNVDKDFKTFMSYFNENAEFQLSRVKFPLKGEILDDNYENIETLIRKENYQHSVFILEETTEYKLEIIEEKDEAIIEIRGIDNGIMADYVFKKVKGQWQLSEFTDLST